MPGPNMPGPSKPPRLPPRRRMTSQRESVVLSCEQLHELVKWAQADREIPLSEATHIRLERAPANRVRLTVDARPIGEISMRGKWRPALPVAT